MVYSDFTNDPNVFWHFHSIIKESNNLYKATGWIVVKDGNSFNPVNSIMVDDVKIPFETHDDIGIVFTVSKGSNISVKFGESTYNPGNIDSFIAYYSGFHNENKGLIVVDDFYADPDFVREFAMNNLDFSNSNYHKGKRSQSRFILDGTKEKLEKIIGREIINWNHENYANGVFQYCVANDPLVFHVDSQMYAGMVFLTKDAPFETGTSFYSSKNNGKKRFDSYGEDPEAYEIAFKGKNSAPNFYDSTQFEKIDEVGNVYNRLVIFDAKQIHAPSKYFGDAIENARFFHMFFFDVI